MFWFNAESTRRRQWFRICRNRLTKFVKVSPHDTTLRIVVNSWTLEFPPGSIKYLSIYLSILLNLHKLNNSLNWDIFWWSLVEEEAGYCLLYLLSVNVTVIWVIGCRLLPVLWNSDRTRDRVWTGSQFWWPDHINNRRPPPVPTLLSVILFLMLFLLLLFLFLFCMLCPDWPFDSSCTNFKIKERRKIIRN